MWQGVLSIAALLLVAAGLAKFWEPEGVAEALRALRLPRSTLVIRTGAMAEATLGAAALVVGGPVLAVAVGVSYGAFALFVLWSRRSPEAASCGCFGRRRNPPSLRHAVLDLLLGLACLGAAISGSPSLGHLLWQRTGWGLLELMVVVVGALLGALALSPPAQDLAAR